MKVVITYLIYIIIWEAMAIGGFGYAIFGLGYSGWWAVVALLLSGSAYPPSEWAKLIEGKHPES